MLLPEKRKKAGAKVLAFAPAKNLSLYFILP